MKNFLLLIFLHFSLSGCNSLDGMKYQPEVTPDQFMASQPSYILNYGDQEFVINQPTSGVIVLFVGFLTLFAGYRFFIKAEGHLSRKMMGAGFVLTGLGAISAGVSYQLFGYELKCAGRALCIWTSWYEIYYLLLSALGTCAWLISFSYSHLSDAKRRVAIIVAIILFLAYSGTVVCGLFSAQRLFLSFEFLVAFFSPVYLFLIAFHAVRYSKRKKTVDYKLRNTWLMLIGVGVLYAIWLATGWSPMLWKNGIWFSENDVLHIGMIAWVLYVLKNLPLGLTDADPDHS